jgi:hypothetical protein
MLLGFAIGFVLGPIVLYVGYIVSVNIFER